MTAQKQGNLSPAVLVTLLMIFFIGGANGWVQAVYQQISDETGIDYATVMYIFASIPSALTLVFSLVSGAICGRFVSFKGCALFGLCLFTLGGLTPLFLQDVAALAVSFVVYGVGYGLVSPMAQALSMKLCTAEENARVQGWGVTAMKVGNIAVGTLVGALVSFGWTWGFAVYGFGLACFVLVALALPSDKDEVKQAGQTQKKSILPSKEGFPRWCYAWPLITFTGYLLFLPVNMNMSAVVVGCGLGDSMAAVMGNNLSCVGGILCGLILGTFSRFFGKYIHTGMFLIAAVGLALAGWSQTLPVWYAGIAIGGFGFSCITAMTLAEASRYISKENGAILAGLCVGLVNCASALAPFAITIEYMLFDTTSPYLCVQIAAVGFALMAVIIGALQWHNKADTRTLIFLKKDENLEG